MERAGGRQRRLIHHVEIKPLALKLPDGDFRGKVVGKHPLQRDGVARPVGKKTRVAYSKTTR